jgi:DNA-directed RNA polymerase subunit beta
MGVPHLTKLQRESYERFLQLNVAPRRGKKVQGLEALLQETFPITSYDGCIGLEYSHYSISRSRYELNECRKLKLTYGAPLRIHVSLNLPTPSYREECEMVKKATGVPPCQQHKGADGVLFYKHCPGERVVKGEEAIYLGDIPLMIGGGEFVINGAERTVVSQLHRSPGVDFSEETGPGEKHFYSCRIIPERGSWIEVSTERKEAIKIRIDQSGKFAATMFLRALSDKFSTTAQILRRFYPTEEVKTSRRDFNQRVKGKRLVDTVHHKKTKKVVLEAGEVIEEETAAQLKISGWREIEVVGEAKDLLIINTLAEDQSKSHEEALLRIYQRLRPGSPPQLGKAVELFSDKFRNLNKYRLGRVGRFRINRKLGPSKSDPMFLEGEDFANILEYFMKLRSGKGEVDDIDHLGNRQVRTIEDLASDEFRKGFIKLRRTVQERMSITPPQEMTPRGIINSKTISSVIDFFFGRSELSQVVDQTNPLAQLTHERRLSALGPGGLNRKRAGFEVRDVHISHYGRICPIETPEGANIGLISSLAIYADVDQYGFLITPYRRVKNGIIQDETVYLRADEEQDRMFAPADVPVDEKGRIIGDSVITRRNGDFRPDNPKNVEFIDVSSRQLVGVSASLVPFLEHNDANRALMGSNMQRQAVPLLTTEPPIVVTGMEKPVAENSSMVVLAENTGKVTYVDAERIVIDDRTYTLRKFAGLNEKTCLNQRPLVKPGDDVKKGKVIADGAATKNGELALGKNLLVAFMPWDGYNFEDAILVSERLLKDDVYTSIHINEFEAEIRETKLGCEEFTREIPNVSERILGNLDEEGVIRVGTKVGPGDILVGKVVPKSKSELSPEEKLLHAIFGRMGEDVKNESLEVPGGVEGIVIETLKFSRKFSLSDEDRKASKKEVEEIEEKFDAEITEEVEQTFSEISKLTGKSISAKERAEIFRETDGAMPTAARELREVLQVENLRITKDHRDAAQRLLEQHMERIEYYEEEKQREVGRFLRGDELPTGVLGLVKASVATRRALSVGDKMAGRHGNKGVIAKILPEEDMPFLEDGTPVDILLNPLGVPSRMNLGQILETHCGWAARKLGIRVETPIFSGLSEEDIIQMLKEAGLPESGQTTLFDGRTGEPFAQKVTVGHLYMMKLHHLVDDKVHARATGPYSLITQQPLGGKARFGGQRFGEMEVWALEAYGAANTLQELLTVKSDDVDGRTKIYESMVKGENTLEPGTPVSFEVLVNEIRGLALNMQLHKAKPDELLEL